MQKAMKSLLFRVLVCAAVLIGAQRPAHAMVEFCPAQLEYTRVGTESAQSDPATLFGLNLSALGARTITSATIAFDTSAGWYTMNLPDVTLAAKQRHYTSKWVSFVRRDYVSPPFYVRFPQALTIRNAWVYSAAAQDDGAFGWHAMGLVSCDPPAEASPEQRKRFKTAGKDRTYTLDPADEDRLSDAPAATALVLAAQPSKPLEISDCAEPFREATVDKQVEPQYPSEAARAGAGISITSVEVAIEPNGTLQEAWVWGPSGFRAFDDAALAAARNSTYKNARAYCKDVPGRYFFRVTFDPYP